MHLHFFIFILLRELLIIVLFYFAAWTHLYIGHVCFRLFVIDVCRAQHVKTSKLVTVTKKAMKGTDWCDKYYFKKRRLSYNKLFKFLLQKYMVENKLVYNPWREISIMSRDKVYLDTTRLDRLSNLSTVMKHFPSRPVIYYFFSF